jgi:hypothetical protein
MTATATTKSATQGPGNGQPLDAVRFLKTIFAPGDYTLFRPVESWIENGKKNSRVDYRGISYLLHGLNDSAKLENTITAVKARSEREKTNTFFGVCPRLGMNGQFDQAWQVRVVRTLWSDIDDCQYEEAIQRCKDAGIPVPSIVVNSGNGCHLYWLLAEPFFINDVGSPPAVHAKFIDDQKTGKKKRRQYILDESKEKVYLDKPQNVPPLSAKALCVQDVLSGIAAKIGGDHTQDLSRILRLPGTLNRKDQRNGREPRPCELIYLNPGARYPFSDFEKFADESPSHREREQIEKVKLPTVKKISPKRQDQFNELITQCELAPVGTRSETDFALCCWAIEHGIPQVTVWGTVQNVGKFAGDEKYFLRTWDKAANHTREKIYTKAMSRAEKRASNNISSEGGQGLNMDGDKPVIVIGTDEKRVVDEAITAMSRHAALYQRGGGLVHIVNDSEPPRGIARPKDAPRISNMPLPRLREILAESATWQKETDEGKEYIHPPEWTVKEVAARGQWAGIRRLENVVESPVLRADGSVLQTAGYDPLTGLILSADVSFPPIPDKPSKTDAMEARDLLFEVITNFPFKTDIHRAAWLASTLTPFSRYAIDGPAPLFFIDANVRGCGKSLLADATGIVSTGRPMPRMTVPRDDEEVRKRITAVAIAGEQIILLDNVTGNFGSQSLDAAITARTWSDRILGTSEMAVNIPLYVSWFATGNNVYIQADTARRVCHIRLESPEENPEERSGFIHPDLLAYVRSERPRLAAAAVTILSAYWQAGRPEMGIKPWGSFEAWSALVRSTVVWVGLPDPGETRLELRTQSDREAVALNQLMTGWSEIDPAGRGLTVVQTVKFLNDFPGDYEVLRSALWELCPPKDGKNLNPRSIGMKLHHLRQRVVGGRCFDRRDSDRGAVWMVVMPDTTDTTDTSPTYLTRAGAHARTRTQAGVGNTVISPCSVRVQGSCPHDTVEETRTSDGYVNRQCRDCGEWLPCQKVKP